MSQAWRTEIICENLYGSVANDKRTKFVLILSKGTLEMLEEGSIPFGPGDRQGLTRKL